MSYPEIDTDGLHRQARSHAQLWHSLPGDLPSGRPLLIGIDGHSGAGKSTLASALATNAPVKAAVLHTDDVAWHHSFFDWYGPLIEHVLTPLRHGRVPLRYRPRAWIDRDRPGAITVPTGAEAVLVEGVGVGRRELRPYLDALIWVSVSADEGRRRVTARGVDTEEFIDDWMNQENALFAEHRPWEIADLVVCGESSADHQTVMRWQ